MQNGRSKLLYAALVAIVALVTVGGIFSDVIGGKEVAGTLLALFGTFLGALFAFRLNQEKERQLLLQDRKAALNRALFVLHRQYNAICTYQKHLATYTSPIERALMLPAQNLLPTRT